MPGAARWSAALAPFVASIGYLEGRFTHARELVLPSGAGQLPANLDRDELCAHDPAGRGRVDWRGWRGWRPSPGIANRRRTTSCLAIVDTYDPRGGHRCPRSPRWVPWRRSGPPAPDGTPVILTLLVDDADATGAAVIDAGAAVVHPVADHPYGRGGRLLDPYGHRWLILQPPGGTG